MTISELLALPVGSRLRWEEADSDCEMVERYPDGSLRIVADGNGELDTVVSPDDDLPEFAGSLERLAPAEVPARAQADGSRLPPLKILRNREIATADPGG